MAQFETARLLLRPFALEDLAAAHAVLDGDPEVWRYDPGRPLTLEEREEALRRRIESYGAPVCGSLAVVLKEGKEGEEGGELIGYCGLQLYLCERIPHSTPEVELFYKLGRAYWGRGYAEEACGALIRYAFEELRLLRIVTCTHRENTRSLALLRRLGMEIEPDATDPNGVLATLWHREVSSER